MSDTPKVPCSKSQELRLASRLSHYKFEPYTADEDSERKRNDSELCDNQNVWNAWKELISGFNSGKTFIISNPDVQLLTTDERDSEGNLPGIANMGLTVKHCENLLMSTGCCAKEDFAKSAWTKAGKRADLSKSVSTGLVLDLSKA